MTRSLCTEILTRSDVFVNTVSLCKSHYGVGDNTMANAQVAVHDKLNSGERPPVASPAPKRAKTSHASKKLSASATHAGVTEKVIDIVASQPGTSTCSKEDSTASRLNILTETVTRLAEIVTNLPIHAPFVQYEDASETGGQAEAEGWDSPISFSEQVDGLLIHSAEKAANDEPSFSAVDSVLKQVAENWNVSSKQGPAIQENFKEMLYGLLHDRQSHETIDKLVKKYNPPANLDTLLVPKVNALMWDKMSQATRVADVKFQKMQNSLIKSLIAQIEVANALLTSIKEGSSPPLADLFRMVTDAIGLASNANFEINMKRREAIKPDLNPLYRHLCSSNIKFSKELFGDDVSKHVKDLTEVNKVANRINPYRDMHQFSRGRGRQRFASQRTMPYSKNGQNYRRYPVARQGTSSTSYKKPQKK